MLSAITTLEALFISASSSLANICQEDSSKTTSNFVDRYVFNRLEHTLRPCAEFTLSYLVAAAFIFTTVLALFNVPQAARIPYDSIRIVITCRLFVVLSTTIVLFVYVVLGIFSSVSLAPLIVAEYAIVSLSWLVYALVWIFAIENNTWPKPRSLTIFFNIAAMTILLLAYQRVQHYGYRDSHCFGVFFISACQIAALLSQFYELYVHFKLRNAIEFERFDGSNEAVRLLEAGDEGAGLFSRLMFCWVNPLIMKGYLGELNEAKDLFRLPPSMRVSRVEAEFFENAPNEAVDGVPFSLVVGLLRTFGVQYFSLAILRLAADGFTFCGPIFLHMLVTAIQTGDIDGRGLWISSLLTVFAFAAAFCDFNYNFYLNKIAIKVRCATMIALYDRLLTLPQHQLSAVSSGQLINFITTDVDRIVSFITSFHAFWSMPLTFAVALYLLYREVGLAFLTGLGCALILVPINYIARKIGEMSFKLMSYKDQRLKLVTEMIRAIRTVKVSNWEPFFESRINEIRHLELRYLKRRKYLDAICVYLWASAPLLIMLSILTTYTYILDERLTPARVFTSFALVSILILPLNAYPWVLNSLVEAWVSKNRVDKFFKLKSMQANHIYSLTESENHAIELKEALFQWPRGVAVGPLTFSGAKGSIIGIAGSVGAGKTTLLLGILGEALAPQHAEEVQGVPLTTTLRIRQLTVHEGIAYVGQEAWVIRGTIRENILCGSPMNEEFYRRVLDATALLHDIARMPGGDLYEIADDGSTLSGGQRARLALARAVYHETSEICLLDDPFAALDSRVGRYVWRHAIEELMRDRGRLVIIATHNTDFLRRTNLLVRLSEGGRIESVGPTAESLQQAPPSAQFGDTNELSAAAASTSMAASSVSEVSTESESTATTLFDNAERAPRLEAERAEKGTVRIDVYWSYAKATGFVLAAAIGIALLFMQTSKNLADAWLSKWTLNTSDIVKPNQTASQIFFTAPREPIYAGVDDRASTRYYLTVYVSLAAINTIFTLLRAFLFAKGGIVAAKNLHASLLKRLMTATFGWIDSTPCGRIVNRLCSDIYMVDDSLPFQLNIFCATVVNLAGALILCIVAMPLLLIAVVVLSIFYYGVQRYFRYTTCEVKRITSLTLSPLYGHIADTVVGLVTVRAFRFEMRFLERLRTLLDAQLAAQYTNLAGSQWLSVRLQLLGVLMVAAISFTAVVQSRFYNIESGLVGLAITYALTITGLLNNILSSFIETEKELVSVERIVDYVQNVPKEESNEETERVDRFLYCRSAVGEISFTCVSLRYAPHMPLALTNVTFRIDAGQRVAIIGRTGAGKTSIFQALLRAHPIETGKIFIDSNVDLCKLDPKAARSLFGVITQAPFLFSGTIRQNLRMDNYSIGDEEICALLVQAGLGAWLERAGGLNAEVFEAGANFSYGERQILCVCRLVLSKPKIVLIDEATAHMDDYTHTTMNHIIRTSLPLATVLSIVHCRTSLNEFDHIIEMSNSFISRQGSPDIFGLKAAAVANKNSSSSNLPPS